MPDQLPNLLFDFGGVLINIDYGLTVEAMRRHGSPIAFTQAAQAELFDQLETGRLSPAEFRAGLRQHYGLTATDEELDAAWNAMLLDVPAERLALLADLRDQGYQTALLSNTNQIHIQEINRRLREQYGLRHGIADCLDRVFYSQEVGLRKPEAEIFGHALREMNWQAAETLFIEDSFQHIETARRLGLHTLFLAPPLTLTDALPAALRAFPAPSLS
ncbi:putative hydrolase of the HAD superfamily [Hymenobacter daecheongensis DSM 21074]|uniref:Putative hydrolase of the HAD superfamily n=1 Tax=Hymenobacter daecheongensis DSM 21074 TaxID=1121955 RepID=A0A1M6F9V4_9BACT|nr:HAD family phosphatase [Hymenobacter daecheongensis]SHI94467.1 putative hydrolase of the HAD superfamily [Hymenobacter daecheongensis DSM 21074]